MAVFSGLYPSLAMLSAAASLHHVQSSPHPLPEALHILSSVHISSAPWLMAKEGKSNFPHGFGPLEFCMVKEKLQ